jgi:hypothetical protein
VRISSCRMPLMMALPDFVVSAGIFRAREAR